MQFFQPTLKKKSTNKSNTPTLKGKGIFECNYLLIQLLREKALVQLIIKPTFKRKGPNECYY